MARAPRTGEGFARDAFLRGLITRKELVESVIANKREVVTVPKWGFGYTTINLAARAAARKEETK